MTFIKKYFKYFLSFTAIGISTVTYYSYLKRNKSLVNPEWLDKYLLENDLQRSIKYQQYRQLAKQRGTFFDSAILSEMNAFNHFALYKKKSSPHIYCIFSSKQKLSFHNQIMHGGATATLIDTNFFLFAVNTLSSLVATAKLSIIYKQPLFINQFYIMQLKNQSAQPYGKRLNLQANIKKISKQNQDQQKSIVLATAEMVQVSWNNTQEGEKSLTNIMQNILLKKSNESSIK